ncbi:MAG: glutamine--fructose-6-phosphate transaminase (isomerizing) [Verrucomicrobiae bacterium]|nr:glutamine--fructose-6-phosphate transaminase (isomerizing) [Verrucomicrobiae bacterium]
MCGIVGYVGKRTAAPVLMDGLRRLEYRGYDSAGICTISNGQLEIRKLAGRVERLAELLAQQPLPGVIGISHTRWATHGPPTDTNAHPHLDQSGKLAMVHNGIIENYLEIRRKLQRRGHTFRSQTDSEVLCHLIGYYLEKSLASHKSLTPQLLTEAVTRATGEAKGTYAIAVVHAALPGVIVGARRGSPLVVGLGQEENFLASDVSPIVPYTKNVIYLNDGDVVAITATECVVQANGRPVKRPVRTAHFSAEEAERGKYPHFMLKEIFEQPERAADLLKRTLRPGKGTAEFEELALSSAELARMRRLVLVGCGTSYHAALVGEYVIERLARIPVEVEYGSEMRYRDRPLERGTTVVSISQSGETADTLAAVRVAKARGARTLAIVNVPGSTIARESDAEIHMRAGPEIGVASTKALCMQLLLLTLLGLALGRAQRKLSVQEGRAIVRALAAIPGKLRRILQSDAQIRAIATKYANYANFLYLGRQLNYPIALEGALKLKEISYIHAEGYPSAEMKHGPIALVSPEFPTVIICPQDTMYEKNMSNLEEIKARNGKIIAVATEGDEQIAKKADDVIYIPPTIEILQPVLAVVPLQLFAYHVAVLRGCDVDKPRNLAKSVTVE